MNEKKLKKELKSINRCFKKVYKKEKISKREMEIIERKISLLKSLVNDI